MNELTHKRITKLSLDSINHNLSLNDISTLIEYSAMPDKDETDGAFKYHFYNPATNRNFRGEHITALTKLEEHYVYAAEKNDYQQLGRALHFLVDLNTPVHTFYEDLFDGVFRLKQHTNFESLCDSLMDSFLPIPIDDLSYYSLNDIHTIGKGSALTASALFAEYDNNPKRKNYVARMAISNAIMNTCGVLYHFLNERGLVNV